MPFTPAKLHGLHSLEVFYGKAGVAIKQDEAFVVMPWWKLAEALAHGLKGGYRNEGSYGIYLSGEEVESLTDLAYLASLTQQGYNEEMNKRRIAGYDEQRAIDIRRLEEMESQLHEEILKHADQDVFIDVKRVTLKAVQKRLREQQALQNGEV